MTISTARHMPSRGSSYRFAQPIATVLTGVVALSAYAGAVGLVGGGMSFGAEIDSRLPFSSPSFAGLALVLWVALPMTIASWAAARQMRRAGDCVLAAGVLLVAWIGVQLLFIQTYSWLQPAYLLVAILVIGVARGMYGQRV